MRFTVGFATFLLAFGLRRVNAGLGYFAVALAISAFGALVDWRWSRECATPFRSRRC